MKTTFALAFALLSFLNPAQAEVITGSKLMKTLKPYLESADSLIGVRSMSQMCHIDVTYSAGDTDTMLVSLIDQETGNAYASIVIDSIQKGTLTMSGNSHISSATYLLNHPTQDIVQYLELKTYEDDPSFALYIGVKDGNQVKKFGCAYDF